MSVSNEVYSHLTDSSIPLLIFIRIIYPFNADTNIIKKFLFFSFVKSIASYIFLIASEVISTLSSV